MLSQAHIIFDKTARLARKFGCGNSLKSLVTKSCSTNQGSRVLGSIAFYWIVSISLVFLNKLALVGTNSLDAPLFVTWTQLVVAVLGCAMLAKSKTRFPLFSFFPSMEYNMSIAAKVLPLSIIFMGMITFNNLCLKYVEVSFYHVARALSVVFNVLVTYLLFNVKTSRKCILAVAIVVFGYILGCDGEVRFSVSGVFYGILSSVFVALYSNFVKKTLPHVGDDAWRLMIYNNINAAILMPVLIMLTGEVNVLLDSKETFSTFGFWVLTSFTGLFGFLINIATFLQIQYTSPLTHNVSGIAKATVQTGLAYLVFENPVSFKGIVGLFVVLGGSFGYAYQRKKEMDMKTEKNNALINEIVDEESSTRKKEKVSEA